MELLLDKKRNFVFDVAINNFPYTYQEIVNDLSNEHWTPECITLNNKFRLFDPQSQKLKIIAEWLSSKEVSFNIINTLYESDPYFVDLWRCSPEELNNVTYSIALWTLDKPGFKTSIHLDNRFIVGNGMIYFINGDDSNQSTVFYSSRKRTDRTRISTGFASGWFAANSHDAWHEGFNLSNVDRYSLYWSISLRVHK